MADILTASRAYLLANGPLAALIGNRLWAMALPQSPTLPAVTVQVISDVHELLHDGPQGLPVMRVQYDCWATTYASARAVAGVLRVALDGYTGTMGTEKVGYAGIESMVDDYEPATQRYRVIVDVKYQRSE